MKGVILDLDTLSSHDLVLDNLQLQLEEWEYYPYTHQADVAERIKTADVVLTNKVPISRAVMVQAKQLKLIAVMATGTDVVDIKAADDCGVSVCNAVAYSTASVAQHTLMLILSLCTRLIDYTHAVDRGDWQKSHSFCLLDYPIQELAGKKLGIIGYGNLGRKVASIAKAFDMEVLIAESFSEKEGRSQELRLSMPELLAQADVISLHCPLTPQTQQLINANAISLMKPSAMLINTARGGLIDDIALISALKEGRLAGAAIDVLDKEPPSDDSLLLQGDIPNLIVSPHIAWASRESRQRLIDQLADVINAFRGGKPINVVTVG